MTNCECKRVKDPSGLWDFKNLIGAKVYIKSIPISNLIRISQTDVLYTISNIQFRVSVDGKAITIIELEEIPGSFFTWKDLCIDSLIKSE